MSPLRIAIVGCGSYAGVHAGRLRKRKDARIVACVDQSESIARAFIAKHLPSPPDSPPDSPPESLPSPLPEVFVDLPTMLRDVRPDAVYICTPHTLHFEHAMAALEAGCHVFMEKPMVTSASDAHQLYKRSRDTGRVFVVGYNTPCTPEYQYLRRVIDHPHGEVGLGELQVVSGYVSQNWMRWAAGTWRQNATLSGGGFLYDTAAHLLAGVCWAVRRRVDCVHAMVDDCGAPVDINGAIVIRFADGPIATLAAAGNCPSDASHLTFCFAGGRIEIDGWNGSWINVFNAYGRVKYPRIEGQGTTPDDNFIDAIAGRAAPATTAEDGVIQCELMDAIYESARTGMPARPKP